MCVHLNSNCLPKFEEGSNMGQIAMRVLPQITSAVLRLECSTDCISGSVGHQQNIFRSFFHCQRFL